MICDLGNPLSIAYSKVSIDTWADVKSVDVHRVQCVTPATLESDSYFSQLNWAEHIRKDLKHPSWIRYFTPSEKSCFMSMFNLWVKQAETSDRILILEHDAYVRDASKLEVLMDKIHLYDLWLCGIALETVSMHQRFAMEFVDWLLSGQKIDLGPMDILLNFFNKYYSKPNKRRLWPCSLHSPDPSKPPRKNLLISYADDEKKEIHTAPVTQCIYFKGQENIKNTYDVGCSTIEHTSVVSITDNMEILDSLPLDN